MAKNDDSFKNAVMKLQKITNQSSAIYVPATATEKSPIFTKPH